MLDELRRGNNDAYKQLFITYYSPLCEFASQYISDDDAEELVQELMLYIWETRESIIIESSLKSYLFTATKHRCLNFIKKNQYHEQVHSSIYEKLKDQFEDPDYYLINDLTEQIEKAINDLPENYKETFTLSRFGRMKIVLLFICQKSLCLPKKKQNVLMFVLILMTCLMQKVSIVRLHSMGLILINCILLCRSSTGRMMG